MKAILCDVTRCVGCEKCVVACTETNRFGPEHFAARRQADGLSSRRALSIVQVGPRAYARKACMHCVHPACVDACLVGAIRKTPEGPVVYDAEKCIGCRYCMLACPFGIPRYEWDKALPFVVKCSMCADRQAEGKQPACVEACPHDAVVFGDRDELLAEAHRRIESKPGRYVPHVYGEDEAGGTCVLYISNVELDALGWPGEMGDEPMAARTWPVMNKTPAIALTVCGGLTALTWIVQRRNKLARERAALNAGPAEANPESEESSREHA